MCLYSKYILNRKYTANKKNGGIIPPITDERTKYVPIGCMDCIECRKQKARAWQVRMHEEIRTNRNGKFITLTFNNETIKHLKGEVLKESHENGEIQTPEGYDLDNRIATKGIRLFLERWRKANKRSVRHWLITELGHKGTENIHIHGIIWTDDVEEIINRWNWTGKKKEKFGGFVWKGDQINGKYKNYVNEKTINYIIKYITKVDEKHKGFRGKIHTSKGLGANYIQRHDAKTNAYRGTETKEYYRTKTGHKINLPIYWRNKIYTETQREKLWLCKLDKEIRYVCGEKVSIKHGQQDYENLVQYYRIRNRELGYGTGYLSEEEIEYQKQRRKIMQLTREQNTHPLAALATVP